LDEILSDLSYEIFEENSINNNEINLIGDIKGNFYAIINTYQEEDINVSHILKGIRLCDFDSYMKLEDDLKFGDLRLLEVDNPVYIPFLEDIRFFITSMDVIHS